MYRGGGRRVDSGGRGNEVRITVPRLLIRSDTSKMAARNERASFISTILQTNEGLRNSDCSLISGVYRCELSEFFDTIPVGILLDVLFRVFRFSKVSFNVL